MDVMGAATHECTQQWEGKVNELPSREEVPAVLPPEPFHSTGQQTGCVCAWGEQNKPPEINNHHPQCVHLPLIYGPATVPFCPQSLSSQLLFVVLSFTPSFPPASWHTPSCHTLAHRVLVAGS